jgi:adenylate kinase
MEAEIMQVVLDEARESYAKEIVIPLQSDSIEHLEENVNRISQWIESYMKNAQGIKASSS